MVTLSEVHLAERAGTDSGDMQKHPSCLVEEVHGTQDNVTPKMMVRKLEQALLNSKVTLSVSA